MQQKNQAWQKWHRIAVNFTLIFLPLSDWPDWHSYILVVWIMLNILAFRFPPFMKKCFCLDVPQIGKLEQCYDPLWDTWSPHWNSSRLCKSLSQKRIEILAVQVLLTKGPQWTEMFQFDFEFVVSELSRCLFESNSVLWS